VRDDFRSVNSDSDSALCLADFQMFIDVHFAFVYGSTLFTLRQLTQSFSSVLETTTASCPTSLYHCDCLFTHQSLDRLSCEVETEFRFAQLQVDVIIGIVVVSAQ